MPLANTLNQTTNNVIAMRRKNPAITAKYQLATNYEAVKSEVIKFNRKRLGLSEVAPIPFLEKPSQSASAVAGAAVAEIKHIKRAAQGTAVVIDWLGAGGEPVAQELAEKRASICVACPKNQDGAWYTTAPAELIRKAVSSWQTMKGKSFAFETAQGDKLKSCSVCACLMRLKVFVGLDHILAKTPKEILTELPDPCWIKRKDA